MTEPLFPIGTRFTYKPKGDLIFTISKYSKNQGYIFWKVGEVEKHTVYSIEAINGYINDKLWIIVTKLPHKWCIRGDAGEISREVADYINKRSVNNRKWTGCCSSNAYYIFNELTKITDYVHNIPKGYTLITFEQFLSFTSNINNSQNYYEIY